MTHNRHPQTADYIRTADAAALIGVHRNTLYGLMKRPDFPVLRIRGVVRIPRVEFIAYLAKHSSGGIGAQ
jgi:excisionase family DNA binding protein